MAMVEGASHIVRYVNPAFCRLLDKSCEQLVGLLFCEMLPKRHECVTLLDRVLRTGKPESHTEQEHSKPYHIFWSFMMWPVLADETPSGVMIQVTETTQFHETTLAVNEALLLGSLRQHERAAIAQTLTNEMSHRIKNNLQVIVSLIDYDVRSTAQPCVQGYEAMRQRIGAIAQLYNLISQSSHGPTVSLDAYLREIAKAMSASLLGNNSGIEIVVEAEALDIDPDHAVSFGLLVNELATNAIKHAFPGGTGRLVLGLEQIGDEVELIVADNGVGMKNEASAKSPEKHGRDYVAIFVRQLGGTIAVSETDGNGTTFRIRLPSFVAPPEGTERSGAS